MTTLASILKPALQRSPRQLALIDRHERLTYRQLERRVSAMAFGLAARNVGPGNVVAASFPNVAAAVVSLLAIARTGALYVGIHPGLTERERDRILASSQPDMLILEGSHSHPTPTGMQTISVEATTQGLAAIDGPPCPLPTVRGSDLAAIAFTSGTTGEPKGIVHDHTNVLMAPSVVLHDRMRGKGERVGIQLPLSTLNVQIMGPMLALLGGGAAVCIDTNDPVGLADWIREESIDHLSCSPATAHDLVHAGSIDPAPFERLRLGVGGANCPEHLRIAYRERFGRDFTTGYGLSEAPAAVVQETESVPHRAGASGVAMAHVELAIFDEAHQSLPVGEVGQIAVRAATSGSWKNQWSGMQKYWHQPELTARSRHGDYLLTGDQGHLDGDGYLYVADRRADVINRGGSKVSPNEVEDVLRDHPRVIDGIVYGKTDSRLGEIVVAVVEYRHPSAPSAASLRAHCRTLLAGFKVPTTFVIVDRLPRNNMGKIDRLAVERLELDGAAVVSK